MSTPHCRQLRGWRDACADDSQNIVSEVSVGVPRWGELNETDIKVRDFDLIAPPSLESRPKLFRVSAVCKMIPAVDRRDRLVKTAC